MVPSTDGVKWELCDGGGGLVFWITGYWCGFSWDGEVCYVSRMACGMPRMLVS